MAWVVPLRSNTPRDRGYEKVLTSAPKYAMLQTDREKEFLNWKFQSMLKRHNIYFYTSENYDIKAAVIERYNRTLKTKMYKYFTFKNTSYIDVLQDVVDSYNSTHHRSIGMSRTKWTQTTNNWFVRFCLPQKIRMFSGVSTSATRSASPRLDVFCWTKVIPTNGLANLDGVEHAIFNAILYVSLQRKLLDTVTN